MHAAAGRARVGPRRRASARRQAGRPGARREAAGVRPASASWSAPQTRCDRIAPRLPRVRHPRCAHGDPRGHEGRCVRRGGGRHRHRGPHWRRPAPRGRAGRLRRRAGRVRAAHAERWGQLRALYRGRLEAGARRHGRVRLRTVPAQYRRPQLLASRRHRPAQRELHAPASAHRASHRAAPGRRRAGAPARRRQRRGARARSPPPVGRRGRTSSPRPPTPSGRPCSSCADAGRPTAPCVGTRPAHAAGCRPGYEA